MVQIVNIKEPILAEHVASSKELESTFGKNKVFVLNLMASPGAGKTSLILQTLERLKDRFKLAVIEGDITSQVDAEQIEKTGVESIQINTHGACHLDAKMIGRAVERLELAQYDCLIVENIGNLVCPAEFTIGESARAMILSVPEGHDKPLKYPLMFTETMACIVNKVDLLPYTNFDIDALKKTVSVLNPDMEYFPVSCQTGDGLDKWAAWLGEKIEQKCK